RPAGLQDPAATAREHSSIRNHKFDTLYDSRYTVWTPVDFDVDEQSAKWNNQTDKRGLLSKHTERASVKTKNGDDVDGLNPSDRQLEISRLSRHAARHEVAKDAGPILDPM
ncbi:MAG: hypothetical protein Q9199_002726, partial [Rusavskia elegans]